MTVTMNPFTGIGATTAQLNLVGVVDGSVELQLATRPDFSFCVAPIYPLGLVYNYALTGLNAGTTYYARVRGRRASGVVEDWSPVEPLRTVDGPARYTAPLPVMIQPAVMVLPEKPMAVQVNNLVPGFPAENLFIDAPVAMRCTEEQAGTFAIYLKTGKQPVDVISLLNTNLPDSAQIRITGGPTLASTYAANGFDFRTDVDQARATADLPARPGYHCLVGLGEVRHSAWYQVLITSAPLPAKMLHVEHLVFGLNRTSKNYGGEKSEQSAPTTTVTRTRSGVVDRVRGWPLRRVEFELSNLTEEQFETLYADLWRYENETALIVPNAKAGAFLHDRILFGDFAGGRAVTPNTTLYNRNWVINSII